MEGPIWPGDAQFITDLDRYISHPRDHPELYSDDPLSLCPLPRMLGVFGRGPSVPGKLEAVAHYLDSHEIGEYTIHKVTTCRTEVARNDIISAMLKEPALQRELPSDRPIQRYHIIDGADNLIFNADSKSVLDFAVMLKRDAITYSIAFICLFDRTQKQPDEYSQPQTIRDYRMVFFNQFDRVRLFFPVPDMLFRASIFRDLALKHLPPCEKTLTDDDFTKIALSTTYATPQEIYSYMRQVAAFIMHTVPTPVLDYGVLSRFLTNKDTTTLRVQEDSFAVECGKGMEATKGEVTPKTLPPAPAPEGEGEEEPAPKKTKVDDLIPDTWMEK